MLSAYRRRSSTRSRMVLLGTAAALGVCLSVSAGGLVQSQPAAAQPAPVAAPAAVQPAPAPGPLRPDQVKLLAGALAEAESHGFPAGAFGPAPTDEAQLRRAIVAYAEAQHGQRLKAADFHQDWGIHPQAYDGAADFAFALSQDKLADWVAALPPPFERYRNLRTALAQYRAIAARGGWQPIAAGPPLKPGVSDPRVIQLRQRLAAENPPGTLDLTSPVYDPTLAAVVAAAQERYGLAADGVVGPGALKTFNVPVEARIAQIQANLERWRWMPRAWPATRIEVNIAGQQLAVFNDNMPVMEMKVVVGAPDKKTPMLRSEIHSVVFNPPWNVPTSIAIKELIPKGVAYLAAKGYAFVSNGAGGSRLQQKPGPGNSLGRIKFDFNNPYGVYLHDTNAKTAFGRDARQISHGCVRVEKPEELANLLFGPGSDRVAQGLAQTATERAALPEKMPVMLLYWTVFVGADGQVHFRDDQYRWDSDLSDMLNAGRVKA